jgi:hypothetical protein
MMRVPEMGDPKLARTVGRGTMTGSGTGDLEIGVCGMTHCLLECAFDAVCQPIYRVLDRLVRQL